MNSSNQSPLRQILIQLKEYYPIITIYSICISVLTLATPISVQSLVNTFSFGPHFQPIFILSVILLSLLIILGVLKSLQYLTVEYLQRNLYAKTTANITRAYFIGDNNESSIIDDKANRYFDVILIHKNLAFLVTDGLAMALQTFIGLLLITFYHPFFLIFGILILIAIITPLYFLKQNGINSAFDESTAKYEVADYIEALSTHSNINASLEEKIQSSDRMIKHFLTQRSRHFKTVFLQNIIYVSLYAVLNALLLALGGYLVISNQLSVGQLVAAEIVVNAILIHFLYAKKYLEAFYDLHAAIRKVHAFYAYIEKNKSNTHLEEKSSQTISNLKQSTFFKKFGSIRAIYSPRSYKKIIRNFTIGTVVVITMLCLTPWQQFSRGKGTVLAYNPNNRLQKVTAPVSGVVEEWLVQDGQFVKKGDPIVRVIDNDPNYLVRLEAQRDAAIAKFDAAKEASNTGRLNFHRQKQLVKEGLSSPKEFEKAKIQYKKLRSDEASAAASLAKSEVDLSRQHQQIVTAPRDGKILRTLVGSGKTLVKAGEDLVDFVPSSDDNAVELFLDGNDLPLVYEGRKVRIQFEGWPAVQFSGWPSIAIGSFGGIVSVIDPSVAPDGTFRVLIKPDLEDSVNWPNQSILRQGARALGIVTLDEVSIGYELWRKINGFPKSMPNAPKTLKSVKDKK